MNRYNSIQRFVPGNSVLMWSKMFGKNIYGIVKDAFQTPDGWIYTVDFGVAGCFQVMGNQIVLDKR